MAGIETATDQTLATGTTKGRGREFNINAVEMAGQGVGQGVKMKQEATQPGVKQEAYQGACPKAWAGGKKVDLAGVVCFRC